MLQHSENVRYYSGQAMFWNVANWMFLRHCYLVYDIFDFCLGWNNPVKCNNSLIRFSKFITKKIFTYYAARNTLKGRALNKGLSGFAKCKWVLGIC